MSRDLQEHSVVATCWHPVKHSWIVGTCECLADAEELRAFYEEHFPHKYVHDGGPLVHSDQSQIYYSIG